MTRRQSGFSLTEVALGVAIVAALSGLVATTASTVQMKSRQQKHIDDAKLVLHAVDQYMLEHNGMDYCRGSAIGCGLGRWLQWGGADKVNKMLAYGRWAANQPVTAASTADGGYPNNFAQANYPYTDQIGRGMIFYFYKNQPGWSKLAVWNGRSQVLYDFYAVQVLDEKGYPLWTAGR